jgi:hypothetical protein
MGNDQPALRALFAWNRAFQNRKSGWSTRVRSFDLAKEHDK